ncbi:MAG: hypothetical protein ACK5PS_16490 [Desulfopila sp.]
MSLKDEWTLESALQILQHPTVDSKLWAEAAEWLLRFGPPSIQKILLEASQAATRAQFPDLEPAAFTADNMPMYALDELARALGISEDEVSDLLEEKNLGAGMAEVSSGAKRTIH